MKKQVVVDGDGCAPFLPDDLIRSILKRLPVRSLIQFQCVCKHWKNLFKTPSFIADHLEHSTHENPSLVVQQIRPLHLRLLNSGMQVREIEEARLIDSLDLGRLFVRIVGSTNGLICVEIEKYNDNLYSNPFLLWNPAIREVRWVPKTIITEVQCHFFVGFGFSPADDDHKIVMIYSPNSNGKINYVKVYSFSSGLWKEVQCEILKGIVLRDKPVTVNGEMFWFGSKENGDNDVIISFDLKMEMFTIMLAPNLGVISCRRLTVYENKLAVLSSLATQDSLIALWVMEKKQGWVRKYTSDPFSHLGRPVTIWRNEVVCDGIFENIFIDDEPEDMDVGGEKQIALCNMASNERRMIDIGYRCEYIFNYAESLVPVGGMKSFTVSI